MKKVLSILVLMLLSVSLFCCDKDDDGCYDIGDHRELSTDGNTPDVTNSGD